MNWRVIWKKVQVGPVQYKIILDIFSLQNSDVVELILFFHFMKALTVRDLTLKSPRIVKI